MKYTPSTESIPQSSRRAVNEKAPVPDRQQLLRSVWYHEAGCFSGLYRGWGPARAFPEELSELPYIQ